MGSQNLFLTIVGIIIVAITIAVAVTMFGANAADANRKAITSDLQYFAGRARVYYTRPASAAGGNRSFVGITFNRLAPSDHNENGRYYIESATADELVLVGRGKVLVDEDTTEVRMRVNEKKQTLEIVH